MDKPRLCDKRIALPRQVAAFGSLVVSLYNHHPNFHRHRIAQPSEAGDGSDEHQQHGTHQKLKTWPFPLNDQHVADAINFPPLLSGLPTRISAGAISIGSSEIEGLE